jgi:formate transporter
MNQTSPVGSVLNETPAPPPPVLNVDAFIPPEMAVKAEEVGVRKAAMGWRNTFALAVLAGAFIALGAIFATTVTAGAADKLPFGITRLLSGLVFCLGLILVVVAGAELFTGNNLIAMAWADRRVSTFQLLRNWLIVYAGNLVGSLATAVFMFVSKQYTFGGGAIGLNALTTANSKCSLEFVQAIALGVMCNALVCLAVWLCFSARTTTDKILSIVFPITAFVAAGFEHSVANMYFIPIGLLVKDGAPPAFWQAIGKTAADFSNLTWGNFFLANLLPVTIGNIIGGSVLVGMFYWFIYIRKMHKG